MLTYCHLAVDNVQYKREILMYICTELTKFATDLNRFCVSETNLKFEILILKQS